MINIVLQFSVTLSPSLHTLSGWGWGNWTVFQLLLNQVMNFRGYELLGHQRHSLKFKNRLPFSKSRTSETLILKLKNRLSFSKSKNRKDYLHTSALYYT